MNYIYPTNWIFLTLVLMVGGIISLFFYCLLWWIFKFLLFLLTLGQSICYTLIRQKRKFD